ncbi:hypothetical protein ACJ72_03549 [Emergomyces africanus]|uniref:Transmembrane protein n=1 Tax=Emergomyces africanus TaxID=1955775 RepID=A0A1B7NZ94_9EURO|nr:hypothetical protein ACJ72_03549 [Emergomyces africanus]
MSAPRSPLQPYPLTPFGNPWTNNDLEQTAVDHALQATQPFTASPGSMKENQTSNGHPRSKYFTASAQPHSVSSQPIPNIGKSESLASAYREVVTLENTVQVTQPPTETLTFSENSKLHASRSTRASVPLGVIHDVTLPEGPKFYPTRELQMPRRGICAQLALLLLAVLPLLLIPAFCIMGFVEIWIPEIGDEHSEAQHQQTAPTVPLTELSIPGEITNMPFTSGLVESTKVVAEPAISLYPSAVEPKGGISP